APPGPGGHHRPGPRERVRGHRLRGPPPAGRGVGHAGRGPGRTAVGQPPAGGRLGVAAAHEHPAARARDVAHRLVPGPGRDRDVGAVAALAAGRRGPGRQRLPQPVPGVRAGHPDDVGAGRRPLPPGRSSPHSPPGAPRSPGHRAPPPSCRWTASSSRWTPQGPCCGTCSGGDGRSPGCYGASRARDPVRTGSRRRGARWSPCVPEKMHRMTDATSLGRARLDRIAVSAMDNNVYLLTAPSGEQLLIDAADDSDAILTLLGGAGPLRTVVTTHGHWDHHRALPTVVAATHARTAAGAPDAPDLPVRVDDLLAHGDRISVDSAGEVVLDVIALRGHTAGSIALAVTEDETAPHPGRVHLFTGDSLFPGGVGKTTDPADFTRLMDDVEERLFGV